MLESYEDDKNSAMSSWNVYPPINKGAGINNDGHERLHSPRDLISDDLKIATASTALQESLN